jgi:gas vesicle structural protein
MRERVSQGTSLVEVLDRVLDKGIVIDASVRVALVGVELLAVDARVVVASFHTYLRHAEAIGFTALAAAPPRPRLDAPDTPALAPPAP